MMNLLKKVVGCALLVIGISSGSMAQTGPSPEAEKNAITTSTVIKPKKFVDGAAAASIWNIKPKDEETTAALHKRTRKMLEELLAKNPSKLNYDTDYWRLLAYLREVPWKMMPESRKKWYLQKMPNPRLTEEQREAWISKLKWTKIYHMTPKELDVYLSWVHEQEPDLRKRIVRIARQNLGQPYAIYLLGEFPHELYDPDPMFSLKEGDCVVFSEHTYAMALGNDWKSFYEYLLKLRYKDGIPGMTTRNHFTEADWNINNQWLLEDVTTEIGATTVTKYTEKIDRARFFKNFGIGQEFEPELLEDNYIPAEAIESVLGELQEGDFVNIVRGRGAGVWVGHVGIIGKDKKGDVTFIHSTEPKSIEQPIMEYVKSNLKKNEGRRKRGSAEFQGMKFLRLRADDLQSTAGAKGASE